jgi:hypothetical protein
LGFLVGGLIGAGGGHDQGQGVGNRKRFGGVGVDNFR